MTFPEGSIRRRRHGSSRWFRREYAGKGQSVCKGRWVQIVYNKRSCFAQWEDCGPFTTEDWPYVFGDKPPVNTQNKGAGIDISPAVRDYLGITGGTAIVHWRFVEFYRIPRGPWSKYGDNNPFVNAGLGAGKKSLQFTGRPSAPAAGSHSAGAIEGSRETQKGTPGITPCAAAAMQRPRILHIFSRYGEVGGEEICFHAITEALGAIADVTPFVYSTEELFHSPHGALRKWVICSTTGMWSKNCANACVKTAMTHGSSAIRSRPCPPASMNWPCINPLPSSTTCTITAPAASTSILPGRSALLFLPRRQLFSRHHARLLEEKRRVLIPGRRRPV